MEKKLLDYIKLKNKESIPTVQPRSSTVERDDNLWAALNKVDQEKENDFMYSPYIVEISGYLQEPSTSPDTYSFNWWRLNEQIYPCLDKVVAEYLAIPATQGRSETPFSAAGTKFLQSRGKDWLLHMLKS